MIKTEKIVAVVLIAMFTLIHVSSVSRLYYTGLTKLYSAIISFLTMYF